ncbi:hypothetical protein ACFYYB_05865 [Streptomyces sp. NPDC002886]|uniref:hypothetical protein n=1 Tax=Streptomyces sp. NPDC002886 TaxID=3364667 RepID=UPI00369BC2FB
MAVEPQEPGPGDGRPLTAGVTMLAVVVGVVSLTTGAFLVAASLAGYAGGAWKSPDPLSPGLIGAAMAGVTPGLFAIGRARVWEEARVLVIPLAVVLLGLFTVSLLNADTLQVAAGASIVLALFSLGWVALLGLLAAFAVLAVALQCFRPGSPLRTREIPLPGWSKPPMAVLGSAWLGIGAGLLVLPGFWGGFIPWEVIRADAQGLGVWALALGMGVLGALAEDDLGRLRPALLAMPGVSLATAVVLAAHAPAVDWNSGPGLALTTLIAGLFCTAVAGHWYGSRRPGAGADAATEPLARTV